MAGLGGQIDIPLIGHQVELEIGVSYLRVGASTGSSSEEHSERHVAIPVDFMLAHVFDVAKWVQPYAAIGPTFVIVDRVQPGLATMGGFNLWTRGHFGLHGEMVYAVVAAGPREQREAIHEFNVGLGASVRY